jgi:glycosyltransferase involved in cell wall biosynthesis
MKVLYDINVLGIGHYNPRARTGVFRVVENIAYGLKKSKACELSFCTSTQYAPNIQSSLDYLDANPELAEVPFRINKSWKFRQGCQKIENKLTTQIQKAEFPQEIPLKIARKLTCSFNRRTDHFYNPIEPISLAETNIYHSPFEPIPSQVQQSKNLHKFLSIMDLIPILYPKFFKSHEDTPVKRAIDGLDAESWALCISQCTKDDLCNYSKSIDPSRVFVTHLAASELFYQCTNSQQIELVRKKYQIPDGPYILSLSTLEPRKNIEHTIRCFSALVHQEKIQDLHLVLVGTKGWDYDSIFSEITNNSNLKERVIVTGYVADEDLAALYSGAMTFVYPSFYEGFGLPPLEAMQCGVPVITSNASSLPEVVGEAGIMLAPKDTDGLCQNLLKLYYDSSLRKSMSEMSLEQAKKFSWGRCTQETIKAYEVALNS